MNYNETRTVYRVEARSCIDGNLEVGDQVFANKWKPIKIAKGSQGVKSNNSTYSIAESNGYFSYRAAKVFQIWFLNDIGVEFAGLSLETRITSHTFELNYSITETGEATKSLMWNDLKFEREIDDMLEKDKETMQEVKKIEDKLGENDIRKFKCRKCETAYGSMQNASMCCKEHP
jgi:hypothetical protein